MTYDERVEQTAIRCSEFLGLKIKAIHQTRTSKYNDIYQNRFVDHLNEIFVGAKSYGLVVQPYGTPKEHKPHITEVESRGYTVQCLGKGWWNKNTMAYLIQKDTQCTQH